MFMSYDAILTSERTLIDWCEKSVRFSITELFSIYITIDYKNDCIRSMEYIEKLFYCFKIVID